jgi:3-hydroxyisobutyrate dehydrogenase-like beta-hydroxyacid dehydrogenase
MCVTNTPVAVDIISEIAPHLQKKTMIIDITTHKADGSINIFKKLNYLDIMYVESPVIGGPVQAEEGVLGQ